MANADSTEQTGNDQQKRGIDNTMCSSSVMHELWERASDNMTADELKWFAGATDHAEFVARQLQNTIEGVGCLVSADGDTKGIRAGNFQDPDSVASLLFGISHAVADIRGLINIGNSARARLDYPELYGKACGGEA
ncbi:MAG: hypothetical protein WA056_10090 [Gallionella sp.]